MTFIVAILLYSIGRPNLIFHHGMPAPIGYLAPFVEIAGVFFLFKCLAHSSSWKRRLLVTYGFALAACVLTFNGFWLGVDKLTGFALPGRVLIFLIFALIQYPQLLIISLIFPKILSLSWDKGLLFWALIALIEWYNPGLDTIQTGQTWIEFAPYLNLATVFGLPVYTFFSFMIAWLMLKGLNFKYVLTIISVFVVANLRGTSGIQKGSSILMVQTNHEPYSILFKKHGIEPGLRMIDKSIEHALGDLDLVKSTFAILPETTFPVPVSLHDRISSQLKLESLKKILDKGMTLGVGAPTTGNHDQFQRYYNSFWVLNNHTTQRYDKRILMPLAESALPLIGEDLTNMIMPRKDFTVKGASQMALSLNDEHFLVDICFDGDVPYQMREKIIANDKVDFLVNVANDSWFNPSSQANVHLWRTRWMSALYEKPMVRVSNGGTSASIKWDGTIADIIPAGEFGSKEVRLWYPTKYTENLFLKWGILPFVALVITLWLLLRRISKRV